jgi:hypothetical protein
VRVEKLRSERATGAIARLSAIGEVCRIGKVELIRR